MTEEELNSITIPHRTEEEEEEEEEEERGEKNTSTTLLSKQSLSSPTSSSQSNSMSNKRGGPAEPPSFLQEVAFLAVSALFSCLVLSFGLKRLDPNRQTSKAAEQRKKEIAKRLGRPKLVTNVYEDAIAADVANPDHINVTFNSIGGLEDTKEALQELVILPLVRPELFSKSNLLKPAKGVLLYGPPGTGKTLLAKALAKESQACFINVRTSTLQSKWFGDAQKLVTAVFTLAWKLQPSIIFIDEIDSFLGTRKNSEHEAVTQMKTEFMTLWDGFNTDSNATISAAGVVLEIEFVETSERSVVIRTSRDREDATSESVGERVAGVLHQRANEHVAIEVVRRRAETRHRGLYFSVEVTTVDHLHRRD